MSYTAWSIVLVGTWMLALSVFGTRHSRVVDVGTAEYKRIFDATLRPFGVLAIVPFLIEVDVARSYVLLASPAGVVALLFTRWLWRQWLISRRVRGEYSSRVLLLGSAESLGSVARDLIRSSGAGYNVIGAIATDRAVSRHLLGTTIPLTSDADRVDETMDKLNVGTLVITSSAELPAQRIRQLSWSLEPGRRHLLVAPSLAEVGGPRIHMRAVPSFPLMHIETPRYEGFKLFAKRAFDIAAAALLIVLSSPVMVLIAMAIRLSSPGPILFQQNGSAPAAGTS